MKSLWFVTRLWSQPGSTKNVQDGAGLLCIIIILRRTVQIIDRTPMPHRSTTPSPAPVSINFSLLVRRGCPGLALFAVPGALSSGGPTASSGCKHAQWKQTTSAHEEAALRRCLQGCPACGSNPGVCQGALDQRQGKGWACRGARGAKNTSPHQQT